MVYRYFNDDGVSDSGSERSNSPNSGNGARPTDDLLSHNGSSGALVGPVAARRPLLGGAGSDGADDSGVEADPSQRQMTLYDSNSRKKRTGETDDEEMPPPYDDDEDEGVGMEQDASFESMHGGRLYDAVNEPTWSFAALESPANNSDIGADADNDDNGSMDANISDEEGGQHNYGSFVSSDIQGQGSFQLERHNQAIMEDEDDTLQLNIDSAMEDAVRQSVEVEEEHGELLHDGDTEMKH
jgi:hypothetical protein